MVDILTPEEKDRLLTFMQEGTFKHTNDGDVIFKSQIEALGLTFEQAKRIFRELENLKCLSINAIKKDHLFYDLTSAFDTLASSGGFTSIHIRSEQEAAKLIAEMELILKNLGEEKKNFPEFVALVSNLTNIVSFGISAAPLL